MTISGAGGLYLRSYNFNVTGNLSITGPFVLNAFQVNTTVNFGSNTISCAAFRQQFSGALACTVNFNSCTLTCTSFGLSSDLGSGSELALYFGTSAVSCSGNFLILNAPTKTVDPGTTATITITNTCALTSAGQTLPGIVINASGKVVTQTGGALTTGGIGTLTLTAGTYTTATYALTLGGALAVNGTSTLTLTSSTVSIGGSIITAAGCTFTTTSATFTVTAASTVTCNGKSFPYMTFQQGATFADSITFARAKFTAAKTYTFTAGITFTLTAYTAGDWDGTAGNLVTLTSSGAWTFTNPASMTLHYVAVAYSAAASDIIASDGTSTDNGGNNTHWIFIEGTIAVRAVFKTANTAFLEVQTVGAGTSSFTVEAASFNEGIDLIAIAAGSVPAGYSTQEADVMRHILFGDNVNIPKLAAAAGKTNYVTVDENGKLTKGAQL
jgi:hypothetical protein